MSDVKDLLKKVNELIDLVKADPRTKLPGVLINKALPAPASPAPVHPQPSAPKMNMQKPPGMPKPKPQPQMQMQKGYEGFKAVEAHAKQSGASDPAAVAAAVGRKKYGKEAFQEAAAHGHKMGKAYTASEQDSSHHLAKWMKKCSGSMMKSREMMKSDEEKRRMTDPNVAEVRREETQDDRRAEHEDQVKTHAAVVKQKEDLRIDQDKKSKPVQSVKKADSSMAKGTAGNPVSRPDAGFGAVIIKGNTASAPVSRPDAGFGAVIVKDDQPHPPGTGEHSAHEVVEHGHTVPQEIKKIPHKEVGKMLRHLRQFGMSGNKEAWKRSPGNKR